MSSASLTRQHGKNLKISRELKDTLTGFHYAGLLKEWQRKAFLLYLIAMIFCAADRDLIKGLWKRPHTFPPIPIEVSGAISKSLGWMLNSASKFEAQHRSEIEQAMEIRSESLAKIEKDRLAELESRKEVESTSQKEAKEQKESSSTKDKALV